MSLTVTIVTSNYAKNVLWRHICFIILVTLKGNKSMKNNSLCSFVEDMETVKSSLDNALKTAVNEINDRMKSIKADIDKIKYVRESEKDQKRRVRREVVTYYEGYAEQVD